MSSVASENTRLRAFIELIVDANGPYPELNGTQIVRDAYAVINPVADILRNSLPVAHESAPPVPDSLKRDLVSLTSPLHAIREQMALRGGTFVQQLSQLMRVADSENMKKIVAAFPEVLERYDALATADAKDQALDAETRTRYFTDGTSIWKFEPGEAPMHRFKTESSWDESAFTNLAEFEASPGDTWEINAEEGGES